MLGMAMMASRLRMGREKGRTGWVVWIFFSRRAMTSTASTQLTPWHRKVAQATPATPILKAVTKRMSTAMLEREEAARNRKGVLESPRAEKMPVLML